MFTPSINLDRAADAIESLSPEHRQSIHLAYYAGFSNEQVAGLLGVTVEVADARLHDGLVSLREVLRIAA
ncbi:MAG: hypothetical protein JWM50_1865 [Microbacteriaceae bacterium]|jgi:DNA-directed RNA polymerase specialized sigma24 family protein|nr:hypothetical protein [Microbacteriaceae bacterium]